MHASHRSSLFQQAGPWYILTDNRSAGPTPLTPGTKKPFLCLWHDLFLVCHLHRAVLVPWFAVWLKIHGTLVL